MRFAASVLAVVGLTGCVHIAPHPIVPAESAKRLESRSLADPGMQQFVAAHLAGAGVPIARWDLESLTLAAFYFHPDLDVARAQAAVARAAIVTAGERPNPTLSLPVEHKSDPGLNPWVTVLGLDVPIETAGKRALRRQHAEDLSRAAELAIAQAAWQIRSAIRAQLVAWKTANQSVEILGRQREIQGDLVEALQKRLDLGEGSQVELTQVRIAARQTELLLRDRQAQAAQARARLAAAIGIPESALAGVEFHFDPNQRATADNAENTGLRTRALVARPDILVALADYAASESDLRLELAGQYPDLHLSPGFGWDQGNLRWDFGLSATLPILSRNRGPIAEAVARRTASEALVVALQARIIAAVDEASGQYRQALSKLSDADHVVELQTALADAARRSFDAGQIDRVALRTAQLELETAELARADAVAQTQQALGALEDAVEQPLAGGRLPAAPIVNPREGRR